VCPRCHEESPPAFALAHFVTCRGCGLVIDAAPRDLQLPTRRPRLDPTPIPDPTPAPATPDSPRHWFWRLEITNGQGVVILLVLAIFAYLSFVWLPQQERELAAPDPPAPRNHYPSQAGP
jgi:hypothetical protein